MSVARPLQEAYCSPSVPQTSTAQTLCPEPESALLSPAAAAAAHCSTLQQSKCQASREVLVEGLQNLCS